MRAVVLYVQMVAAAERVRVQDLALELGFTLAGVCPAVPPPHLDAYGTWINKGYHASMSYLAEHVGLKGDPDSILPGAKSMIVVALNYNQPNPHQQGQPRIARYALGRDYHKVIRSKLRSLEGRLREIYPNALFRACVDSAPICERDYGQQAGLGWFGKNTMLINSKLGSWFFLGVLITDLDLEPDEPAVGGCGTCQRCVEACPTGAIVYEDDRWQVDARRCISYLTIEHEGTITSELESKMGDWTFGCDVCQEVCPFNQPRATQPERAAITNEADFLRKRQWPSLLHLQVIEEREWDEITRGSPVRRTGIEGLRRNAAIALRNLGATIHNRQSAAEKVEDPV